MPVSATYSPEVTTATLAQGRSRSEEQLDQHPTWRGIGSLSSARRPASCSASANPIQGETFDFFLWSHAARPGDQSRQHYWQLPLGIAPLGDVFCNVSYPVNIPWWEWAPELILSAPELSWGERVGGRTFAVVGVPVSVASTHPELGIAGGDLAPAYGALAVGAYEPSLGRWTALGGSTGNLPPLAGTAFALAVGGDGLPHMFGIGGDGASGPQPWLYDGSITASANGTTIVWTRTTMNTSGSGVSLPDPPGPRTHAAAVGSPRGDAVFVFGGNTGAGVASDLWQLDPVAGLWNQLAFSPLPSARTDAAMATDGTRSQSFGGRDPKDRC